MHNILLVYGSILGISLMFILFSLQKNDETAGQKLARVRVRVDDNQRQPLPPEEDAETPNLMVWALLGTALLLIWVAANSG